MYVTADKWEDALTNLSDQILDIQHANPQLFALYRYLRRTYRLPIASIVSIFKRPLATNNICELYHKLLKKHLRPHSALWKMLCTYIIY